jgi:hypothetical protein
LFVSRNPIHCLAASSTLGTLDLFAAFDFHRRFNASKRATLQAEKSIHIGQLDVVSLAMSPKENDPPEEPCDLARGGLFVSFLANLILMPH